MNIEALIAAKKTERANNGLHIRVEFENRVPYDRYPSTIQQRDYLVEQLRSRIGKRDRAGDVITAVSVL